MSPQNERGTVTVTTTEKQESYALNGEMNTVGDALDKFFGDEEIFSTHTISLNGSSIDDSDLDRELRASDVILALTKALASGGVKGAI